MNEEQLKKLMAAIAEYGQLRAEASHHRTLSLQDDYHREQANTILSAAYEVYVNIEESLMHS